MLTDLSRDFKHGQFEGEKEVPTAGSVYMVGRSKILKYCFRKRKTHKL
jgi:hypothetical protein